MNSSSISVKFKGVSSRVSNIFMYKSRVKSNLKYVFSIFVLLFLILFLSFTSYSSTVNSELAQNLLRLHVIANSDSAEDQTLKRQVKDAIIDYLKSSLTQTSSAQETETLISGKLHEIEDVAKAEMLKRGKSYPVKAYLGKFPFPTKTYGDVSLPAGKYNALRVVIGTGKGANWWCVLFPPLCYVDATHSKIPDSLKQQLKGVLNEDDYSLITAKGSKDLPIKLKFKIVEMFQNSWSQFSGQKVAKAVN